MAFRTLSRSSPSEVFLGKGFLKTCSKFTGEKPCRGAISIKLLCNFIEIAPQYRCSPVNLLHIFRTLFLRTPLNGCFCLQNINDGNFCKKIILQLSSVNYVHKIIHHKYLTRPLIHLCIHLIKRTDPLICKTIVNGVRPKGKFLKEAIW